MLDYTLKLERDVSTRAAEVVARALGRAGARAQESVTACVVRIHCSRGSACSW